MLGTTFGGSYLACAAAISVIEILQKEALVENAARVGDYLIQKLKSFPGIKEVRGLGLMIGIELEFPASGVRNELLKEYKIFTGSASGEKRVTHSSAIDTEKEEADIFLHAFQKVLQNQLVAAKSIHMKKFTGVQDVDDIHALLSEAKKIKSGPLENNFWAGTKHSDLFS